MGYILERSDMKKVLLLASGMSAKQYFDYPYKENGWTVVAVNNGWQVTDEWDHWVRSNDFKGSKPTAIREDQVECKKYGHILNEYGGHIACGYSIALCAGYYSLYTFKPSVIGFLGADMNYTPDKDGNTHIYGLGNDIKKNGIPDPDKMVQKYSKGNENYLHDIYMRFHNIAKENNCAVYNFSDIEDTRLPYTKSNPKEFK